MVRVHIEGSIFATCSNDHTIRVWLTNSKDCKVSKGNRTVMEATSCLCLYLHKWGLTSMASFWAGWITRSWAHSRVHCLGARGGRIGDKRGSRRWQQEGSSSGTILGIGFARQDHTHLGCERWLVPAYVEWARQLGAWFGIPSGWQIPGLGQWW